MVFLWWWCGGVFCGDGVVFVWWCFCGGVVVFFVVVVWVVVLWLCFWWWCFCGGVVVLFFVVNIAQSSAEVMAVFKDSHQRLPKVLLK